MAGLSRRARRDPRFHYHYVTAREMYNLIRAAEAGWDGPVAGALDHEYLPGPALLQGPRRPQAVREGAGSPS